MILEWDRNALEFLVNGYDINYGARSIKHEVERRVSIDLIERYSSNLNNILFQVVNQIAAAHEYGIIGKDSHLLITADLPPNQLAEQNMIKTKDTSNENEAHKKMNKNYDIRLKKITLKNKKQVLEEISLEINSFGKYCLTKH